MTAPRAGGHVPGIWWGVRSANPRPGVAVFGWFVLGLLLLLLLVVPLLSDPAAGAGGVPLEQIVVAWLVLAFMLAVFTLLWHAAVLAAPGQGAALARYCAVLLLLVVGTALATNHVLQRDDYDERAWWLLAPNPYAVLVDAVADPIPGPAGTAYKEDDDDWYPPWNPLDTARLSLNFARDPVWQDTSDDCEVAPDGGCVDQSHRPGPVWPYGLVADATVAAGALALATRRQGVPV
jgi:hypothetical protein